MIPSKISRLIVCLTAIVIGAATHARATDADTLKLGRHFTEVFQQGGAEEIWQRMSKKMQEALGDIDYLKGFQASISAAHGPQTEIVEEETERGDSLRTYRRRSAHENGADLIWRWSFGPDDRIEGFYVRRVPEASSSAHLDYQTRASLELPFTGDWYVFWGGRTLEQNYHAENQAQRFAYDFIVREDGSSHVGDGAALEDYYCWDRPILAPADGTVVAQVDGLPDQAIGETDAERPAGNHVVLDLGAGEFVFLAHLRRGSVKVEIGDGVRGGDEIGRCGNSGNTSEPHLHMHMQTTPDLKSGEGLPAQFQNYRADGVLQERGEPVRGQTVSAAD
ncbi:M23 family metallopeptidase [uncultured Nitratireductor sp.]|uniref:M23 family metallopeptidase n=1 Tax=uncultured Nitratireductor sp. TaxID=520953 RepID=UPI0025D32FDD|nr:M23 family metallopeptidase [uncultured Nitratireductor sp.]